MVAIDPRAVAAAGAGGVDAGLVVAEGKADTQMGIDGGISAEQQAVGYPRRPNVSAPPAYLSRIASNGISNSIATINTNLQTIATLNKQISVASLTGGSAADLEDQRNNALQAVSQQMGINYFVDSNNEAQVYSDTGAQLVGSIGAATLAYAAPGSIGANSAYPGAGIAPITLNGADITASLKTGTLGALVALRDTTLPNEQAKLDGLANVLATTVNTALNQGTAAPPLSTLTGTTTVTAATSLAGSTGNLRLAVTDSSGIVQSYTDLNMSSYATVGALVTALNGLTGVSASISASGYLTVNATAAGTAVSLNPLTSSVGGTSATQFFGFNNLFVNNSAATLGASNIQVNSSLLANSSGLATATLNASGTLAVGDHGVSNGDASTTTALVNALNSAQNFAAAGNFASQTATLSNYAGAIIAGMATQASAAKASATTETATYTYLSNNLSNETGVNIDEETANLTTLQTNYQANAQLISTIKQLFNSLLQAVAA